jgi:hypothetical protein
VKAMMRSLWLGFGALAVVALLWAAARLVPESAAPRPAEAALKPAPALPSILYLPLISKPQPNDLSISRVEVIQGITMSSAYRVHIANRPGILRVFPALTSADGTASAPNISARLTCYQSGITQTQVVAGPITVVTAPDEGNLNQTYNFNLPAQCLALGASYAVELDTTNILTETDEANNRYPLVGAQSFDWQSARPVRVVLVPIDYGGPGGTGHYLPDTLHTDYLCSDPPRLWPISAISCSWASPLRIAFPVLDDGTGWDQLLYAVTNLHTGDADALYYGVINIRAAGQCGTGCVAGMGWIGSGTAVGFSGWNQANNTGDSSAGPVFTHEGGHNFGRPHAPCGTPGEAAFPYAGGIIGQWGYDPATATLYNPTATKDYMSYCSPKWTSDYTYKKIFDFRANSSYAPEAAPNNALHLIGTLDAEGGAQLYSATRQRMPLTPDTAGGTHRVEVLDAQGQVLAALMFTPTTIAIDSVGPDGQLNSGSEISGFNLALPALPGAATLRLYAGERLLLERAIPSAPTSHAQSSGGQ